MESQFLIMQLRKLDSPTKSMSEHQLIFFILMIRDIFLSGGKKEVKFV